MSTSTTQLDQQTIELVKATVPILEERGDEITSRFYQMMFENHPELKIFLTKQISVKEINPKRSQTQFMQLQHILIN